MYHPFADLVGLQVTVQEEGHSQCEIEVCEKLLNPNHVVHGAVIYSLADTGMGAALVPGLNEGDMCATIEIKINYYRPVRTGAIKCDTVVIFKGKSLANMESNIFCDDVLVAKANGSFSIFTPRPK